MNVNLTTGSSHRFEYDPSPDASQRRQNISDAVGCPGCGAALGIPSIRPIKVTCPQCLQGIRFCNKWEVVRSDYHGQDEDLNVAIRPQQFTPSSTKNTICLF